VGIRCIRLEAQERRRNQAKKVEVRNHRGPCSADGSFNRLGAQEPAWWDIPRHTALIEYPFPLRPGVRAVLTLPGRPHRARSQAAGEVRREPRYHRSTGNHHRRGCGRVVQLLRLGEWEGTTLALLIITRIVLVVLIILLFVGFKWVDPESLRLKVYNRLEFEMRGKEPPESPRRAIKPS
jgi:hypothetical protein